MKRTEIRETMEAHGLPGGLLPGRATLHAIDEAIGAFEVHLPARVERRIGGYRVRYGTVLRGILEHGVLARLEGVTARGPLLWVRVRRIEALPHAMRFSVGPVTRDLPLSEFR